MIHQLPLVGLNIFYEYACRMDLKPIHPLPWVGLDFLCKAACDSRRKHKAWGASPQVNVPNKRAGARDSGRQTGDFTLSPVFTGTGLSFVI
jgi:hypothetical protein